MPERPFVAIVDCGSGNLFSVRQACAHVGLHAQVTADPDVVERANAVILPGVGAFGSAAESLHRLALVRPLRAFAESGRPLVGICLGLQLLLDESAEFGRHEGLGLIPGRVEPLPHKRGDGSPQKVPHIGWSAVDPSEGTAWADSLLARAAPGEFFYFVHSFYAQPIDRTDVLATARFGDLVFPAALRRGNVTAFQFHPERSGPAGLELYAALARSLSAGAQG